MDYFMQEEKIRRRIHEIEPLRYRNKHVIDQWYVAEDITKSQKYPPENFPTDKMMCLGDTWQGRDHYLWLQSNVTISENQNMFYFDFGKTGGGNNSGFESLLFINGVPVQGVDSNHKEFLIEPIHVGKEVTVTLKVWSGLEGGGEERILTHQMNQAFLGYLDEDSNHFYYLSKMILETIQQLPEDHDRKYRLLKMLTESFRQIDWRSKGSTMFYESLQQAYLLLKASLAELPKSDLVQITAIGHTHIDLAWLWRLKHTREKATRSFSTVLKLMKEYPEYVFLQTQPQIYQYIKEDYPELYEQIKERIAEGRWEVDGAMWVEADCNIPSGESLIRQILYGKKFIQEEFGQVSSYLWLPDVFGYSWALPQILKKSGIQTFMTTKISWNQYNRMPNDTFLWRGLDGSEILTHFITTPVPGGGSWTEKSNWFYTYNGVLTPETVLGAYRGYQNKSLNQNLLISYGHGDGGGGVTREMLENRRKMAEIPGLPVIQTGRADTFFEQLHETVAENKRELPVWDGELYLEYHRGTYTSQAFIKKMNRFFEISLRELECLYSFQSMVAETAYPYETFETLWKSVLKNQFHDIIPGSSIKEVYQDYREEAHSCKEQISLLKNELQSDKAALSIINTTSWQRTSLIKVAPDSVSQQVFFDGSCYALVSVPGFEAGKLSEYVCELPVESNVVGCRSLETAFYQVSWNEEGHLTRIYDKKSHREVLAGVGNVFQLFEDKPLNFDAWDIDLFYQEKGQDLVSEGLCIIENNPLFTVLEQQLLFGQSRIVQKIYFYTHTKRIDFKTEVDWQERQQLLKVKFDVNIRATEAVFDIQHGNVKRPTHWNTSWDIAKFESVGHQWADIAQQDYGVALLNDCKYGYDIKGNQMRLSLLKGAIYPDPFADLGNHTFTYSLFPHKGDFAEGQVMEEAWEINAPMSQLNMDVTEIPFEIVSEQSVIIDTLKLAEDRTGWVLRCYDHLGSNRELMIKYQGTGSVQWQETNMMEEPIEELKNVPIVFSLQPYEVKTIQIVIKKA
jgi:alpha-mannosidase